MDMWILLGILSAFCSALVVICDKLGTHYIDSTMLGIVQTAAILFMLLCMQFYQNGLALFSGLDLQAVPYILAASFFTGVSYVCYYLIITYTSVSRAAALNQFTIIFTIYLAMAILGDTVSFNSIVGSILMIIGMGFMVV